MINSNLTWYQVSVCLFVNSSSLKQFITYLKMGFGLKWAEKTIRGYIRSHVESLKGKY